MYLKFLDTVTKAILHLTGSLLPHYSGSSVFLQVDECNRISEDAGRDKTQETHLVPHHHPCVWDSCSSTQSCGRDDENHCIGTRSRNLQTRK